MLRGAAELKCVFLHPTLPYSTRAIWHVYSTQHYGYSQTTGAEELRIALSCCNPRHTSLGVSPTEPSRICSWVDIPTIVLYFSSFPLQQYTQFVFQISTLTSNFQFQNFSKNPTNMVPSFQSCIFFFLSSYYRIRTGWNVPSSWNNVVRFRKL